MQTLPESPSPVQSQLDLTHFAGRYMPAGPIPDFPGWEPATDAQIAETADRLAWGNDAPDSDLDWPGPGWQADPFDPSDDDVVAYRAAFPPEGGCRVDELSPDEQDLLVHTLSDWEYGVESIAEAEARASSIFDDDIADPIGVVHRRVMAEIEMAGR